MENEKPDDDSEEKDHGLWKGGLWKLYISRALTAWGDRLWAFGLGLLLFRIYPENLTLVAAFGLIRCFVSITLGALVGNWIDRGERLRAAKTFLVLQNIFVAVNCCIFASYYHWQQPIVEFSSSMKIVVATVTIILALVCDVASTGSKIVVEKDWIVVIAGGDDDKLAKLNSIFRTIDLVCLNLAPVLAGLLFSYTSYAVTAIVIAAWNLVSVVAEYLLLVAIYKQFPSLAHKKVEPDADDSGSSCKSGVVSSVTGSYRGWRYYCSHRVRNAGLGLALLFMTVLGFDTITWSYSLLQCVPESVLGALVAASALVGIAGSVVFPHLRACLGGTERAGVLGMGCLVTALSLCVVSIWCPGSPFDPSQATPTNNVTLNTSDARNFTDAIDKKCSNSETRPDITSVSVMLAGIIAARFGLWLADLSVTQIVQENVEETKRGVIGGVQNSLNSAFNMIKFCLVLIMPQQNMFGILIILSFVFICFGAISLTSYAVQEDKLQCPCHKPQYEAAKTEDNPNA